MSVQAPAKPVMEIARYAAILSDGGIVGVHFFSLGGNRVPVSLLYRDTIH